MGRKPKFNKLQQLAVNTLKAMTGYRNARIAELLLPFIDDQAGLDSIHKRIDRIQVNIPKCDEITHPLGTYAIHGLRFTCGEASGTLLIIIELTTGWVHAEILQKVRVEYISRSIYKMMAQLTLDAINMPLNKLLIMSYEKEYKPKKVTHTAPTANVATILTKRSDLLANAIRKQLRAHHRNIDIGSHLIIDTSILKPVSFDESISQLEDQVSSLTDDYNFSIRTRFPKTEIIVCPYLHLRNTLTTIAKDSKKKIPSGVKPIKKRNSACRISKNN